MICTAIIILYNFNVLNIIKNKYLIFKNDFDYVVVGAGISGATVAQQLTQAGKKVLVIDQKSHIGGNIYDYEDKQTKILVHKYGPHIFHTNIENVWHYLSQFTDWHYFFLKPNVMIDNKITNLPFNLNTLHDVFPEQFANQLEEKLISHFGYGKKVPILKLKEVEDLKFLSDYIYDKVFEKYSMKQWGLKPEELDPSITSRVPIYISRDDGYFQDKYQAIPLNGYTNLIKNMLKNTTVILNKSFQHGKYKNIIYTGPIDEYYNYSLGELPYRSLHFQNHIFPFEYYQKSVVTNYPNNYDFTRICEHKHFLSQKSKQTIISVEFPEKFIRGKNERFYPVSQGKELYEKYLSLNKNVHFLGRLGEFKYINMDQAVDSGLKLAEKILGIKNEEFNNNFKQNNNINNIFYYFTMTILLILLLVVIITW